MNDTKLANIIVLSIWVRALAQRCQASARLRAVAAAARRSPDPDGPLRPLSSRELTLVVWMLDALFSLYVMFESKQKLQLQSKND